MIKKFIEIAIAILCIVGSIQIVQKLEEDYEFLDWRYWAHQGIHTRAAKWRGKPLADQHTIVVLIGDEFWTDEYAGRTPLNKTKLAELILDLARLSPRVIALDFNFCSPTMDGSLGEHESYRSETKTFAEAVAKVSSSERTVVLTKFLHIAETPERGYYVALPNRFDGIEPNLSNVAKFGHINLTYDFRMIPQTVIVKDGSRVPSFSQAIAGAFRFPGSQKDVENDDGAEYCGAHLTRSQFVVHNAADILKADDKRLDELRPTYAGKIVIVGAGWTEHAAADPNDKYTPVNTTDSRYGPAGDMPAVFLHANWVESILADRTGKQFSEHKRSIVEFVVGLLAFLLFRGWLPWVGKMPRLLWVLQISYFPAVIILWILVSYLGFQNFGLFIDPLSGLVGALLALGERAVSEILRWRKLARRVEPARA